VTILGFAALAAALFPDTSSAQGAGTVTDKLGLDKIVEINAFVGLKADVDASNHITRLGVTCAQCHSTVDDSVMHGIGKRLDVCKIIPPSPALTHSPDLVMAKLPALRAYQDSLTVRTSATSAVLPRLQLKDDR
jgi:hypothetical protein